MPTQDLGSPHSGLRTTVVPGDPLARSMGQYGKGGMPPMSPGPGMADPTAAAVAAAPTKTAGPVMRPRPAAGTASGPNGSSGSARDYANTDGNI